MPPMFHRAVSGLLSFHTHGCMCVHFITGLMHLKMCADVYLHLRPLSSELNWLLAPTAAAASGGSLALFLNFFYFMLKSQQLLVFFLVFFFLYSISSSDCQTVRRKCKFRFFSQKVLQLIITFSLKKILY